VVHMIYQKRRLTRVAISAGRESRFDNDVLALLADSVLARLIDLRLVGEECLLGIAAMETLRVLGL